MLITDDKQNWAENDNHREMAKLMLIDQSDYCTHHIFFDDQADDDENGIVDGRDLITNEIISTNQMKNKYIIKVEPHRAILEPDYYCKMIETAEKNRDEEVERVE